MAGKQFTVVSHPRSGSTFFIMELGKLCGLSTMMEIFHNDEAVIDQHLGAISGLVKNRLSPLHDTFRQSFLTDPIQYLAVVQEEARAEALVFKIFPSHLPEEKLSEVLRRSHLTIFLMRNVLHSYISNEAAKKVGRYANVDTSEVKVTFSHSAFVWWIQFITAHFENAFFAVCSEKRSFIVVNYEEFRDDPERLKWFQKILLQKLDVKLELETLDSPSLMKQDKRTSALEKVSNPDKMLSFLRENGLEYLIDENVPVRYSDLRRLAPSVCRKYRRSPSECFD
jgi:hypothetical protein